MSQENLILQLSGKLIKFRMINHVSGLRIKGHTFSSGEGSVSLCRILKAASTIFFSDNGIVISVTHLLEEIRIRDSKAVTTSCFVNVCL